MTSFPAAARRVRDADLALRDRLLALRECVVCFAPYGFRATWHQLVANAGIPRQLDADPGSLVRAVVELEEARCLWLAHSEAYAQRRRLEKAAGQRTPPRAERWRSLAWLLAYCPDPEVHPAERLALVVNRLIDFYSSGASWSATCPHCRRPRAESEVCQQCGIGSPAAAAALPHHARVRLAHRWHLIWQRAVLLEQPR